MHMYAYAALILAVEEGEEASAKLSDQVFRALSSAADGRIELVLTGLCRFSIREELPGIRGYRLVQPDWEPYRTDYDAAPTATVEHRDRLLYLLKNYFRHAHLETDWKTVVDIPP